MNDLARLPVKSRVRSLRAKALRKPRKARSNYYAFLSYSHKDEDLADWLHQELEDFHVPAGLAGKVTANGVVPRRLTPIFRDEHELAAADDLGEEIRSALAASQYLIVLCSPNAATSHWTNAEIECFKRVRPDGCVLAAIGSGEPFASENPGREDEECFPPALREKYDRRGRPTGRKAEPLAADLRGGADERRMGFLKLVAGMLGVGLDDLVQREATRRQRRLAWLSAASIAGMAITSLLAITAIQARDSARDQRREAEGLVAFMLGDLKDKLEPIGKLDALDGVGSKVLAYYRKQDTGELSDAGLLQRSKALSLSAQVAYLRGQLDTAEKLYGEALDGTAEAIRRDPDDPERLFEHAQNIFYTGAIAAERGNLQGAERDFRDYQRFAAKMIAIQPDSLKYRMEVQYAATNLGYVLLRQRRYDEAINQFETSVGTMRAVAAVEPNNESYQKGLAESVAWLGDAHAAKGNLAAAIEARRQQVELLQRMASRGGDVAYQEKLIPAKLSYGRLLASGGRNAEASAQLEGAVAIAEKLLPTEPENSKWLEFSATADYALAQHEMTTGQKAEAGEHLRRGCGYAAQLSRPGGASSWRLMQWSCATGQSQLNLLNTNPAAAIQFARQSYGLAKAIDSGDSISDKYLVANSLLRVGDAFQKAGDTAQARTAWDNGLRLVNSSKEQPWESAVHAELLSRFGQSARAREIYAALAAKGIRNPEMLRKI